MPRKAYVISYLPREADLRRRRLANHATQLEFFEREGFGVVVLAQNYRPDDYVRRRMIRYIDGPTDKGLPPGAARNILLREFYESDTEFAVFADDDATICDHCDGVGAITAILDHPAAFAGVDLVVPINSRNEPFTTLYREKASLFAQNFVFKAAANIKGSLIVLRNFEKAYGVRYFFDRSFDGDGDAFIGGEDGDMALQLIADGRGSYTLQNCVLKELGGDAASTWARDVSVRNLQRPVLDAIRLQKFGARGLKRTAKGFDWRAFWLKNSSLPRNLSIRKSHSTSASVERKTVNDEQGRRAERTG